MDIDQQWRGDVLVMAPKGRLDAGSAATLEAALLPATRQPGAKVVVDFAGLDFVSSAGLRILLMAAKASKSGNGRLSLAALNRQVTEVFQISGFTALFDIQPSCDAAVAAIA